MNKIEKLITELCPKGVEFKTLLDVCSSITAGGDLPENYLKNQQVPTKEFPYPIFSNGSAENALYGYTDSYKVGFEAVTISARGTIGYHAVRAEKFTPIVRLITLIPKTEIITAKFLNYALDITEIGHSGGSIPQLTVPNVIKIKIPIPPLAIQKEIVKILDTFTTLEAELEAELEARKKQYEYYRDELLISKEGFEQVSLGDIATIGTGSHDTKDAVVDGDYVFYARGREPLRLNSFDFDENAIITAGDGVGVGKVFHFARGKYALHQRAYRIVPNANVDARFIYYHLVANFAQYLERTSVHASVTSLRRPMFLKCPISLPPFDEQQRIVAILDKFDVLVNDISVGLPAELNARRKQYEYYRDKLLTFKPLEKEYAKQ